MKFFRISSTKKCNTNQIRASTQLRLCELPNFPLSAASRPDPRSMKWQTNGELAERDLTELVSRLVDVESTPHSNELSRLGSKYNDSE